MNESQELHPIANAMPFISFDDAGMFSLSTVQTIEIRVSSTDDSPLVPGPLQVTDVAIFKWPSNYVNAVSCQLLGNFWR